MSGRILLPTPNRGHRGPPGVSLGLEIPPYIGPARRFAQLQQGLCVLQSAQPRRSARLDLRHQLLPADSGGGAEDSHRRRDSEHGPEVGLCAAFDSDLRLRRGEAVADCARLL
uniref:(northern house mosquito) hypothetical protein n=1 Tax=Culex pipiens TaxID=7175 RepID=A0A8D8FFN7_CULPI